MPVKTKRNRNPSTGAIAQLDLADADAADRRMEIRTPEDVSLNSRLLAFYWKKTTAVATDVEIYRVDEADSDKLLLIGKLTADASTDGVWRPDHDEASGRDVDAANLEEGIGWRIQFGVAGGACLANVWATVEER